MGKHQKNANTSADEQQTSTGNAISAISTDGPDNQNADSVESKHEVEIFIKQEPLNQDCPETDSEELKSQIDAVKRKICGDSSDEDRTLDDSNHTNLTEIEVKIEPLKSVKTDTEIKDIPRSRLTADQRWIMVEFIKRHRATVWGRCAGPVAARKRAKVLAQMAKTLNSTEDGAVKTPKKWLSSLHHWKSDVKKKAAKIASLSQGSGGGIPISGLSAVERELLDAIGEPVVNGHDDEDVPLERLRPHPNPGNQISRSRDLLPAVMAKPSEKSGPSAQQEAEEPLKKRKRRDEDVDDRIAAAMERQAEALTKISQQFTHLTDVFTLFYNRWAQQTND